MAVAHGAACYGWVRRGGGERIKAGLPRAYYIGVDPAAPVNANALCLAPAGLEEGLDLEIENRDFELRIRQPVEFPIFSSSIRTMDRPSDLVAPNPEELKALPPIRTVLRSGKKGGAADAVQVRLHTRLTEIGVLEVWCAECKGNRTWRLQFDIRSATQTDLVAHTGLAEQAGFLDKAVVDACCDIVRQAFGAEGDIAPEQVVKQVEQSAGIERNEWPPSLLRELWDQLFELRQARSKSVQVEARWLNLLGFCLRPGYGFAVDDWRVAQTWRLVHEKLAFPRNEQCRAEWWILWRRIGGGLTAGQQQAIASPLISSIKAAAGGKKGLKAGSHERSEIWRFLASLEWLAPDTREFLGNVAMNEIARHGVGAMGKAAVWAVARLGARTPSYGPLNTLASTKVVSRWLEQLVKLPVSPDVAFACMQLARRTDDRFRDIDPELTRKVLAAFDQWGAPERYARLVETGGALDDEERQRLFGESLPPGLRMVES